MKEYPDDIPWREVFKAAIPFLVILVVYFTVMAAISAPSIAWMIGGCVVIALKCPVCGAPVPPSKGRKPRKYCSAKCNDKAKRRNRYELAAKSIKQMLIDRAIAKKSRLAKRDADYAASPYAARVTVDCVRTTDGRTLVIETRGQRCIGWRSAGHVSHG